MERRRYKFRIPSYKFRASSVIRICMLSVLLATFCLSLFCSDLETRPLRKIDIAIDGNLLRVEIAATPKDREQGLMYRKTLAGDEGMLFIFPSPRPVSFWMKHTFIPLDIGYFNSQKRLIEFFSMQPDNGKKTYPSSLPVLYAVETQQGWYKNKGLKKNALLELPFTLQAF